MSGAAHGQGRKGGGGITWPSSSKFIKVETFLSWSSIICYICRDLVPEGPQFRNT